ncbi:MAG: CHAT domain-containing protein [Verrucomicrobiales bacterium]|nr:CHAT domain-containing protein [Verrucomicrobiales bacterium]
MNTTRSLWFAMLIGVSLSTVAGHAQEVITLAAPELLTFENGYDIVDKDGNFIKRVEGPTEAAVQAYVEVGGIRYFMSDWSLKRSQEGHSPNWMKPTPAPAPMANRVSQEEADRIAANTPKYTPPQQQEPTEEEMALELLESAADFINMGTLERAAGNLAIVEDVFSSLSKVSPESLNELQILKSKLLIRQGDFDSAIVLLDRLVENDEEGALYLAGLFMEVGEEEKALREHERIIDAGRIDFNNPPVLRGMIMDYLKVGDFARLGKLPEKVAKSDRFAAETFGDVLADLNMWELALDAFNFSLEKRSSDIVPAKLQEKVATAWQRTGNLNEAIKHWDLAKKQGFAATFHLEQARYLATRGEYREAGDHYHAFAKQVEPVGGLELLVTESYQGKEEAAFVEAARFLDGLEENERAVEVFEIGLGHAISGPLALDRMIPAWAEFNKRNGTMEEARARLDRLIASGKVSAANAGMAWAFLGDEKRAGQSYLEAVKTYKENPQYDFEFEGEIYDHLDYLAQIYLGIEDPVQFLLEVVIQLGVAPRNLEPSWPAKLRENIFTAALLANNREVLAVATANRLQSDRDFMQRIIDVYPETKRVSAAKKLRPFDVPLTLGDPEISADAVLQFKGVVLDSLARDRVRMAEIGNDSSLAPAFEKLRRLKERYLQQTARGISLNDLSVLETQIGHFEDALFKKSPVATESGIRLSEVDYKKVQRKLEPDEALIEFCLYGHIVGLDRVEKRYVAIIVRANGAPQYLSLGTEEEVEAALKPLQFALSEERMSDVQPTAGSRKQLFDEIELAARTAHAAIWKPVASELDSITRLYLSPDGLLHVVPFAALVDVNGQFVSEKFELSYVGSGRDLLAERTNALDAEKMTALLLANPAFSGTPIGASDTRIHGSEKSLNDGALLVSLGQQAANPSRSLNLLRQGLGDLPGTVTEINMIEPILGELGAKVERFEGEAITENTFSWAVAPTILHLGTHGVFLPQAFEGEAGGNPFVSLTDPMARSFIALTGADQTLREWSNGNVPDPRGDGVMLAAELANLDLNRTLLVVLSACQTGLGDIVEGEGVFGMKRSMRQAGARNLVTTLWNISDEGTGEVMAQFYREMSEGKPPGEALATTQAQLLRAYAVTKSIGEAVYLVGPFVADEIRK